MEWPTCSWLDDGYCNGGNLPRTYIIGNQLHYQNHEWYEDLEDSELKDDALRNKAIMDGFIKDDNDDDDDDESLLEYGYSLTDTAYPPDDPFSLFKFPVDEDWKCTFAVAYSVKFEFPSLVSFSIFGAVGNLHIANGNVYYSQNSCDFTTITINGEE
ncbi:hypothetical protein Tco_1479720 [Tanacetum coccineum]